MLLVVDKGTESCQGAFLVLWLVTGFCTFNQDFFCNACIRVLPDITQAYTGFYLINVLSACTATSEGIPFDFSFIDDYVKFFGFGEYGHRSGGSMHTSLCLCGRNTLYAVYTRFIFQYSVDIVTCDTANDFFESSGCSFICIGYFHFPAFGFTELGIHTEKVAGKDCGFVSSCTTTNFEDGVLAVLRIGRNKHQFDFFF